MSDQLGDAIEQESLTNGFVNVGGWIPLATDWEPYIGEWWFGAHYCVTDNLRRQIAGAVEGFVTATDGGNTRSEDTESDRHE